MGQAGDRWQRAGYVVARLIGQSLIARPGAATTYRTAWFPRRGQSASFLTQVLQVSGSDCELTVSFQEKNTDDADDDATSVGSSYALDATGTHTSATVPTASGLKEQVRCVLSLQSKGAGTEWMHVRVDPPVWQPN